MADKSNLGLKKETAAALAYFMGPITGVIMLILDSDAFVRFHSMQSIVVFGALTVLMIIAGMIPLVGFILTSIISLLGFCLWLALMYKALNGERWEVPVLGKQVDKLLQK